MKFPDLQQAKTIVVEALFNKIDLPSADIQVVASPYRICPLGAHIDHQGGPVLGMTIDAYTLLAFVPTDDLRIELTSHNYAGEVVFDVNQIPESTGSHWGHYVRSAVLALQERFPLKNGIMGIVDGMLPGCGLSSSASVLLAYLYALSSANDIQLEPWDYVQFTRRAENEYMGLNNGILDQTSIIFGQKDCLVHIDTEKEDAIPIAAPPGWSDYQILVAYSGYSRELTTSSFNTRVQECLDAANVLARMAHLNPIKMLSNIPEDVFHRFSHRLPPPLNRRAQHYFDEVRRVQKGILAWKADQMDTFARLMVETCRSSIEHYECGIPAICDLQDIVKSATGIIGSRFMGGGYGGCVVGFVENKHATAAAEHVQTAYRKLHPEVADQAAVYLTQSADGIRFL